MALAPSGWLYMRASRGEVYDLLLMHPKHGMHACLYEQRQMGIGTKAPVSYEDVTRAQFWMQPDDLGEIMRAQGSCQYLQYYAGASMEQRQEVGHGEPTPGRCPLGWPKDSCSAGVSGIEIPDPSQETCGGRATAPHHGSSVRRPRPSAVATAARRRAVTRCESDKTPRL